MDGRRGVKVLLYSLGMTIFEEHLHPRERLIKTL